MKIWNDKEVKNLFEEVENCKRKNRPLKEAFLLHAKKFSRKPNSVRNYYYHEVDNLEKDVKRRERLSIDLCLHQKNHFESFDKNEQNLLIEKIDALVGQGLSVRSACLKLCNGDLALMTRYQNKYQSVKKEKLKTKNVDNVIMFKNQQKILTENDINSLFLGLVKLIKKNAVEDYLQKNQPDKNGLLLKKALFDLNKKDKQIFQLRRDFDELKNENQRLVKMLHEKEKRQALVAHLSKKKFQQTSLEN